MFLTAVVAAISLLLALQCSPGSNAATGIDQPETLKIGAFNVKSFGKTKMLKEDLATKIKKIVERYDVVLIQEIRDKSVNYVRLLRTMLQSNHPFDFVISQRIGRKSYKEQYAFFYRTDRVSVLGTYQYNDTNDVFEREPFVAKVAHIKKQADPVSLIALHSKPEDAVAEIDHLEDVIASTLKKWGNSEPIVLGDLNADCSYANIKKRREANDYLTDNDNYKWLIDEDTDTTTKLSTECAYDRIIVRSQLEERVVPGSVMAFNFSDWLQLDEKQAYKVSDHYPVEMELKF